jgi:hypothetical protein
MRTILVVAVLSAALPAAAAPTHTYLNTRFGYSIAYPADLKPEPESENGDGRVFHSADGLVEARVWGAYNAENDSVSKLADTAATDCTSKPTYRRIARTFFAVSCRAGSKILYEKTLIHGDQLSTFEITYPAADHARWDAVVTAMAGSLRGPWGQPT